jgi:hypothetical protein
MRKLFATVILTAFSASANAATVFFDNDITGFNSSSTTTLTDFEGIVSPTSSTGAPTFTIDGNTYSNTSDRDMVVCGASRCTGSPHDSTVMVSNIGDGTIRIDLVGGVTAIGGLFGDLDGATGTGTLSVFDSSGLVDTQAVNYGDMGKGLPKTFFGWTTTDTVFTALEFNIADNGLWSAVDNVQFGTVSAVPIPAAAYLFASGLGFLGWFRRRKTA